MPVLPSAVHLLSAPPPPPHPPTHSHATVSSVVSFCLSASTKSRHWGAGWYQSCGSWRHLDKPFLSCIVVRTEWNVSITCRELSITIAVSFPNNGDLISLLMKNSQSEGFAKKQMNSIPLIIFDNSSYACRIFHKHSNWMVELNTFWNNLNMVRERFSLIYINVINSKAGIWGSCFTPITAQYQSGTYDHITLKNPTCNILYIAYNVGESTIM